MSLNSWGRATTADKSNRTRGEMNGRTLVLNCHEAWIHQLRLLDRSLDIVVGLPGRECGVVAHQDFLGNDVHGDAADAR